MDDDNTSVQRDLPAGDFARWVDQMNDALSGARGVDVPCGGCTACCTSSQFVHIGPDETETLAHIPAELLFPAPRLPAGNVVLGYDELGHCPMLIDNACSIYDHRPRTCRTYDCRVFPASGLELADDDKVAITRQTRRWKFTFPTNAEQTRHDAIRAAVTFLRDRPDVFPTDAMRPTTTQLAVLAIELHDLFLRRDESTDQMTVVRPDPSVVRATLMHRTGATPPR